MKILSVSIENFMALGSATINLADRGLVLIQGVNEDDTSALSNGAGKSSIADALCWCLYGETARGESGDSVVNDVEKKDCFVRVLIEDGGDLYQVKRYRKHKTNKNALIVEHQVASGKATDLTKGVEKLTQEVVNQIVGCSYDVFCGAVYAGQERMPNLPGMTDKQLKMLIEEASGATILETAYKEAGTRLAAAKSELDNINRFADAAKARLDDERLRRDRMITEIKVWEVKRTTDIVALASEARAFKTQLDALNLKLAALTPLSTLLKQIEECDAKIAGVAGEQKELEEENKRLAGAERQVAIYTRECHAREQDFARAEKELANVDHKIGCPCHTCARPFTAADIAPTKKIAKETVVEAQRVLLVARNALDSAVNDAKTLTDARDVFRASMTDLTATNAQRASLASTLAGVRKLDGETGTLTATLRGVLERAKARKTEENPYERQLSETESNIAVLENDVAKDVKRVEEAAADVKIHEAVAKVFSPAGVRAFLLDEVTPFLNDQTAKYLGTLSDGNIQATWTTLVKTAKGELREKFSIEVKNSVGGKTFGLISGGEKRKVRIACALALQDLVARRATKPIELFVGDEIDDALDSAGLERLTTILEEKARERGSVFIISHNDLKDWCRNSILVKKIGGKSVIEETVT